MRTIAIPETGTSKRWRGYSNLLRKELGGWWRTSTWMIHMVVYLLMVNGLTTLDAWDTQQAGGEVGEVFGSFFAFHALFVMAGVIISAQGSIVGERQEGTAAWILSKPVSRGAFLLSKLTAMGGSFLIVGILVPVVATFFTWRWFDLPLTWAALPVVILGLLLMVLFYLSFALLLGTLFESRKAVTTLGFLMLFVQLQLGNRPIGAYLPGGLAPRLTGVVAGLPLTTPLLSMGMTLLLTTLFTLLALRRLNRMEF